ncbi:LysE family translocator [Nocardioides sp. GY 10113]|uniref:LysE family translocator n=1 Tax=Nocardioides sp. GY 10113 TaxID=2569761 RepID=UPI0010A83C90|nr:LysE family translocator [Nocardioides sp. GY 10113]TIC88821.1 LysE family translocator [Nocardioides sp. GY 10113]
MPDQYLAFLLVTGLLTLTPGPDMALVLRNGVRGGTSVAWWTGLGCCTGIAGYAAASALGLAAVLAASATAFTIVKLAGAAYLVYLGARALWHARPGQSEPPLATDVAPVALLDRRAAFRQGLLSNLLNPKIALIFLTLIPQFVSPGEPPLVTTAVLAGSFLAMAVLWWRSFSLAVGALGRLLARDGVRSGIERLTGVVLIGLGLRVAFSH